MSWASRRRGIYIFGVIVFFLIVLGVPLFLWWYQPANCTDGKMDGDETAIDKGGSCPLVDERTLIPHSIQWARSFSVRDGTWSGVAYIENPNDSAGVLFAPFRFQIYDANNVIVAEREGTTYIMPGSITPVFVGQIDTGHREPTHAYFEFTAPLVWEHLSDTSRSIVVSGKTLTSAETVPRITAIAQNTSVKSAHDLQFVATVFDSSGNAIAASSTVLPLLEAGKRADLVFTWPDPITRAVGRIDIIPLRTPEPAKKTGFML